ncbi:MAG: hypothetical protein LC714_05280 [Actinobacteria bacterium]|nr:hypothetical protein [Actinomycetota bacterium]
MLLRRFTRSATYSSVTPAPSFAPAFFFDVFPVLAPGAHFDDLAVDHQEADAVAEAHHSLVRQEREHPRLLLQGDPLAEDRREQELLYQARYREGEDAVERGRGCVAEIELARVQQGVVDYAEDCQGDTEPEGRDDDEAGRGAAHGGQRPHQESGDEADHHPRYLQPSQAAHWLRLPWS